MANDPQPTPFSLYYYGQDRYGAWPFLLAHVLGRVAHFSWSPERLSVWLTVFMFSAAWPLRWLAGKSDFIVPGYLGVLLLDPVVRIHREPYGWQASTLIWTWWLLRKLSLNRNVGPWLAAACLGSILAVWISPLSGAILVVLAALEWGFTFRDGGSPTLLAKRLLIMMIVPSIGFGVERLLRAGLHQFARLTFHNSYEIPLELDRGHLLQNATAMWNVLLARPWWIVPVGGVLASALFVWLWVRKLARRSRPTPESREVWRTLAVGCASTGVLSFLATVAAAHVRNNVYSERYLALVNLFGWLAAIASIFAIFPTRQISGDAWKRFLLALTALLTTFIAFRLPWATINPAHAQLKAAANWLANRPVPIVLGGYWGTYVFAGLAVPKKVIPIPVEEDYQRTPWTGAAIHQTEQVVVSTYRTDRFGPANDPDRWITDRGEFFQRTATPRFSNGEVTLWIYLNATKRALPISTVSLPNWNACGDESLSIDVDGIRSGELVCWTQSSAPAIDVLGHGENQEKRTPATVEHGARMIRYIFENGSPISRVTLQPTRRGGECNLEAIALFKR